MAFATSDLFLYANLAWLGNVTFTDAVAHEQEIRFSSVTVNTTHGLADNRGGVSVHNRSPAAVVLLCWLS